MEFIIELPQFVFEYIRGKFCRIALLRDAQVCCHPGNFSGECCRRYDPEGIPGIFCCGNTPSGSESSPHCFREQDSYGTSQTLSAARQSP